MLKRIIMHAAIVFGVKESDIIGPRRPDNIVKARHAVMFLARQHGYGLEEIGKAMGGRDHTTVHFALTSCANRCAVDKKFNEQVQRMAEAVRLDHDRTAKKSAEVTIYEQRARISKQAQEIKQLKKELEKRYEHAA